MMKNNIMFKKIILPIIILVFVQQEFYGMEPTKGTNNIDIKEKKNTTEDIKKQQDFWSGVDDYMNDKNLKYLWVFLDNVPFQYGNSKIWKHGEAYYGLSNGIGFFPSALNFGWLKIGIGDAHINVINTIIKYVKTYIAIKYNYYFTLSMNNNKHKNPVWLNSIKWWLFYTVVTDIHLFSFKFFNCVKIKIISIGAIVSKKISDFFTYEDRDGTHPWYFSFLFSHYAYLSLYNHYFILSPRIEINIPGIINYFKGK